MIYELSTGASENMNGRKLYGQRPLASLHVGLILDGQGLLTYWNLATQHGQQIQCRK
jgi:hypothetical protein